MPRLVFASDPKRVFDITKDIISIGRMPENDIEINDSMISRRHIEIRREGGGWMLYDNNSLNGTFVNGDRVQKTVLRAGDVVTVGREKLTFEDTAEVSTPKVPDELFDASVPAASPATGPNAPKSPGEVVLSIDKVNDIYGMSRDGIAVRRQPPPAAQDKSRHFYILYQIGRLINANNDLDDLLATALQLIFEVINADRGAIFLVDAKGPPVIRTWRNRAQGSQAEQFRVSRTILDKVIGERISILTSDAKYDPRFEAGESIAQFAIRSALCVPVWERSEISGAIYLDNVEASAFSENDLELLTAIANQVAIGVSNVRLTERLAREAVARTKLEMYHSPDVVEMLLREGSDGTQMTSINAQERDATILFSDISGFTSMSTRFRAAEIAFLLNGYFDEMTKVIFRHRGSINKFIGDAIMALWGAPLAHAGDPALAVASAIGMLQRLDAYMQHVDESKRFKIRIGINTGPVIAGNIGSTKRMEYTVIGDTVNTAQRLESVAPKNGILIGESTANRVKHLYRLKDVGLLKLKGKEGGTRAYEVLWQEMAQLPSVLESPEILKRL